MGKREVVLLVLEAAFRALPSVLTSIPSPYSSRYQRREARGRGEWRRVPAELCCVCTRWYWHSENTLPVPGTVRMCAHLTYITPFKTHLQCQEWAQLPSAMEGYSGLWVQWLCPGSSGVGVVESCDSRKESSDEATMWIHRCCQVMCWSTGDWISLWGQIFENSQCFCAGILMGSWRWKWGEGRPGRRLEERELLFSLGCALIAFVGRKAFALGLLMGEPGNRELEQVS